MQLKKTMAQYCPKCGCSKYERTGVGYLENGVTKIAGGILFIAGGLSQSRLKNTAGTTSGGNLFKSRFGQVKCTRCGTTYHRDIDDFK